MVPPALRGNTTNISLSFATVVTDRKREAGLVYRGDAMKTLDELEPGDEIVVSDYRNDYSIVTVTKGTKTQITAGGERYNRRDGVMMGHGYSSNMYAVNRPEIVRKWADGVSRCMTAENGRRIVAEQKERRRKQTAAKIIKDTRFDVFDRMSIEDLDEFVALINRAMQPDEATR